MIDQIWPNSNLSEILCLSSLPVSLMATEFRVTEKRWIHHFLQYKSVGERNQRSRANNSKVNNPIRPNIKLIPSFYAYPRYLQVWQISHKKWLRKVKRHHFFHCSRACYSKMTGQIRPEFEPVHVSCLSLLPVFDEDWILGKHFRAQGLITQKWIIRFGPHSNSFKLLCLSSLPASMTKIQSKVTEKSSRARNAKMTVQIRLKF